MTEFVDQTDTECGGVEKAVRPEAARLLHRATAQPKSVYLKIGALKITSPTGSGAATRVEINGRPFPAKAIRLECDVKGIWTVTLDFYAASLEKA